MQEKNNYRYTVKMKLFRKYIELGGCIILVCIDIFLIIGAIVSHFTEPEFNLLQFGLMMIVLLSAILFVLVLGVFPATKRIDVYKGKLIYHYGFNNTEYRISEIRFLTKYSEEYATGLSMNDGSISIDGWDKVSTFSDLNGKKLFSFGLAYENVDRLAQDVIYTQKSIANNRRRS